MPGARAARGAALRPGTLAPALLLLLAAAGLAAGGCGGETPFGSADASADGTGGAADGAPLFREVAAETGLDFTHDNGMAGDLHMLEIIGSGAALFDYDGDGDLDAYLVQGDRLPPHPSAGTTDRLYRNDLEVLPDGRRRLRFTDVTAQAGLAPGGYGTGVATGDYDGDGLVDLYVTAVGANRLLRNRGDGSFEDVTAAAGAGDERASVPAVFFDADRDGDLDLFVGNYVEPRFADAPRCRSATGEPDYCGPASFPAAADRLLRNRGDGSFEEATAAAGLTGGFGPALGAVAADLDGDGWQDLYVANDGTANNLWINDGDGTFEDRALASGAAVDAAGRAQGSMGVDAEDADGDGDLDLFMTHLMAETNTLYLNDGGGLFRDATTATGLGAPSLRYTAFGTAFLDYDNDGRLDLLVVNGAVNRIEELARRGDPFPLHQPNQLFRNVGPRAGSGPAGPPRYEEVTAAAGPAFALSEVSRGAAFGDVDDDGDVDVLVTNNHGPARLLLNEVGARRPWLGVRALAGEPARDALGARVGLVRPGLPTAWRRVRTAVSYASASDPRVLFGLGGEAGDAAAGDAGPQEVVVEWPDGTRERWRGLAPRRYHTLHQGRGEAVTP